MTQDSEAPKDDAIDARTHSNASSRPPAAGMMEKARAGKRSPHKPRYRSFVREREGGFKDLPVRLVQDVRDLMNTTDRAPSS